jgi:molecular chaperone GrpE
MPAQERGIEQEVVAPAGAASSPSDRDEAGYDEAAYGEAASAAGVDEARAQADAASAGSGTDEAHLGSEADEAPAGLGADAAPAATQAGADAAQARPGADAAQARPGADAAQAGPWADAVPAGFEDGAAERRSEAEPAQAEAHDAPAAEPDDADLHERAGKADAYLELAQRTQADFDNYRKRMTREVRAAEARGIGRLARELLPAIDNLERALAAVETAEPRHHLSEGIRLVTAELSAALGRTGIQGYDPKGERFDPVQHEAVAQQPVAGAEPGTVVEVLQAGYRLNEAILRPARVIVAS